MIIRSSRHVNLHSKSQEATRADHHGLLHVPANTTVRVPNDVLDHPGNRMLFDDGTITEFGKKRKRPTDEEIQDARSQSELKGEERPIKPLEDEDPPLQTSSTTSQIPQAPVVTSADANQQAKGTPTPVAQEVPSLIPTAEEVSDEESGELDEEVEVEEEGKE